MSLGFTFKEIVTQEVVSSNGIGFFDTSLTQLSQVFGSATDVGQFGDANLLNITTVILFAQDQDETANLRKDI